jgi:glucose-6-phosphate 1-dehydrogenase
MRKSPHCRVPSPCVVVIFGATGDLTRRKLVPALYNLFRQGLLPKPFFVIGFARRAQSDADFRQEIQSALEDFSRTKPTDQPLWNAFAETIFYHQSPFESAEGYKSLKERLHKLSSPQTPLNYLFYLSVPPKYFPPIIENLGKQNLLEERSHLHTAKVVIEKPFGHDARSAKELQTFITHYLKEEQIYRIDHYLGKETVQNLLVFRFANSIFESLWDSKHIDHIQITVAEDIGIGTRGHFFEEEGLLRDVVQNHMMQLLTLVAMEPPSDLQAQSIHDEKVKVLRSIRPFSPQDLEQHVVRGQYAASERCIGYREELDVNPHSRAETFIALRLFIDNWRWSEVPFYLRAGKRLPKRSTEIAIVFKKAPGVLFQQITPTQQPNILDIRIQPDEGISLTIHCKVPGPSSPIQPVKMDFRYGTYFGATTIEAYERLIWDCMLSDNTLFARFDEVAESWRLFTPILDHWQAHPTSPMPTYPAGSWGPQEADALLAQDQRNWRTL